MSPCVNASQTVGLVFLRGTVHLVGTSTNIIVAPRSIEVQLLFTNKILQVCYDYLYLVYCTIDDLKELLTH